MPVWYKFQLKQKKKFGQQKGREREKERAAGRMYTKVKIRTQTNLN